jgi:hypothetical protein
MPLGLWKSKWEIHREDWEVEARDLRGRSNEIREECRDPRADYDRELAETRLFNRELLLRLEKTYAGLGEELIVLHKQVLDLKAAVEAQTEAILRLVDRFEAWEGRMFPRA